jgi:hypothetical protein
MPGIDVAGRKIAGLLTYNPGPGMYSRLERAVQQMPENVRVQELPGLLKRYKEGVPGWELKETDLDSIIAGRDLVPREELLARVKERSPVYTHREVVLADEPPLQRIEGAFGGLPQYQDSSSPLGQGVAHGDPSYKDYGHGGKDYTEILLTQPDAGVNEYGNHWRGAATSATRANLDAVAHARFDTHGDALRINELQSDLGIHNRKAREIPESYEPPGAFDRVARGRELPFPLEDSWSDLLIKRLALEAARKGHRAIEVASPRAIADKVGGNIENYEHFYGKVVPGAIERLGRKMGGMTDDSDAATVLAASRVRGDGTESAAMLDRIVGLTDMPDVDGTKFSGLRMAAERLLGDLGTVTYQEGKRGEGWNTASDLPAMKQNIANNLSAVVGPQRMNEMYLRANEIAAAHAARRHADNMVTDTPLPPSMNPAGRRYIMSDEMRRRLIEGGVGAAVGTGILSQDDLIERLGQ